MRRFPHVVLALAAIVAPDLTMAEPLTVRTAFVKDKPANVTIKKDGIRVINYRFARAMRGRMNPFKMGEGHAVVFSVTNDGAAPRDFSLAVALFDKEGRLVGAAADGHTGKLDPGDTEEVKVVFSGVTEGIPRAATIFVSLETEP